MLQPPAPGLNPPEEKKELLSTSQIDNSRLQPPKSNDPIVVGESTPYPLSGLDPDSESIMLPLMTSGLFGTGLVDLSVFKADKLKVKTESIPTDIIDKMVSNFLTVFHGGASGARNNLRGVET